MNSEEIGKKVKDVLKKTAAATKNAFETAGNKVQDFSDKNAIKAEKHKLEKSVENAYSTLGKQLYILLSAGGKVDASSASELPEDFDVEYFMTEKENIDNALKSIAEKESLLAVK